MNINHLIEEVVKTENSDLFQYLSCERDLPEWFIERYSDKINWHYLISHKLLSEKILRKYAHKLRWRNVLFYQRLTKEFIVEMQMRGYL